MTTLNEDISLLKRRTGDIQSVLGALDQRSRRATTTPSPSAQAVLGKLLACYALGARSASPPARIAAEYYKNDPTLLDALAQPGTIGKAVASPASTSVAG